MKSAYKFASVLLMAAMLLSACAPSEPTQTNNANTATTAPTEAPKQEATEVPAEETAEATEAPVASGWKNEDALGLGAELVFAGDPASVPQVAKDRKDNFIVGMTEPSGDFNPLTSGNASDSSISDRIIEPLMRPDESGKMTPKLAEKYEVSEDGLTFTFYLRKGVKFHNGEELKASDVEFSYTALGDPNYEGPRDSAIYDLVGYEDYHGKTEGDKFTPGTAPTITGIKVIDDYTISFTFTKKLAIAINNFEVGILPKSYYNFEKGDFKSLQDKKGAPVGCGPYKFVSYTPGQQIELVAFDDYYGGKPILKNIYYRMVTADTRIPELASGSIDTVGPVANEQNQKLVENEKFATIYKVRANSFGYIGLNTRLDKFSDKRVRQALVYGLNREGAVKSFFGGYASVADSFISPVNWAYDDSKAHKYPYDVEKAKALLDEAGWKVGADGIREKDGKKFTIKWLSYTGANEFVEKVLAPMVIDNYKTLGIEVTVDFLEFSTLVKTIFDDQEFEMWNMYWSLDPEPDPDGIFGAEQMKKGGFNAGGWAPQASLDLIEKGRLEMDPEKRKAIYADWTELFTDEVPYIMIDSGYGMPCFSSRLQGYRFSTFVGAPHSYPLVTVGP